MRWDVIALELQTKQTSTMMTVMMTSYVMNSVSKRCHWNSIIEIMEKNDDDNDDGWHTEPSLRDGLSADSGWNLANGRVTH